MKSNSDWYYWFSSIVFSLSIAASTAEAQIIPDNTLPIASQVAPNCTICRINGGTIRGVNQYHSFQDFSIPRGGEAYFNNSPQIQTILTRVTGTSASTIDGLIRSNGNANLFFLNPNGILFGPNAQLNVGGSFFASTATSFRFADGSQFSTIDPQAPPLLTINVATGLQTGPPTFSTITTQGRLQAPQDLQLEARLFNLQGSLVAGRDLTLKGNIFGGDLELLAGGNVTVMGNITIGNGQPQPRLDIRAGLNPNQLSTLTIGSTNPQGDFLSGQISNQGGRVFLSNSSPLGGDINFGRIDTGRVNNGGSLTIEARGNISSTGFFEASFPPVFLRGGAIQSGRVTLLAGNSLILNRADRLTPSNRRESQLLSESVVSSPFVSVDSLTVVAGNEIRMKGAITVESGLIRVQAKSIELTEGAKFTTNTARERNAGDIFIQADSVKFSGTRSIALQQGNPTNPQDLVASGAFSQVLNGATGNGGTITIQTRLLTVSNGAQISAVTNGTGHAGSIQINATEQAVFDGVGSNKANIFTNSNTSGGVLLSNTFELFTPSGAFSSVRKDAIVREEVRNITGNVTITTPSLRVLNGARLTASLSGTGNAGNVNINAQDIIFSNAGPNATTPGAVDDFSGGISTLNQGIGESGNIIINSDRIKIENGIVIAALTRGDGDAGTITMNAKESVAIDRSFILGDVQENGTGIAGDITITTGSLALKNGSRISVDSKGDGEGGEIILKTNQFNLDTKSSITAETTSGQGGDITIDAKDLVLLRRQSLISTTAGTEKAGGNGGNIRITSPLLVAVLAENSDILANAFTGNGGDIIINADSIFGLRPQPQITAFSDMTASSELGFNGNIVLNTLNLDPSQGLQALNLTPVDPSKLIAQGCHTGRRVVEGQSRFVLLGRGGFLSSPEDPFGGTGVLNDLGNFMPHSMAGIPATSPTVASPIASQTLNSQTLNSQTIEEAQGFEKDAAGNFYLVSHAIRSPVELSYKPPANKLRANSESSSAAKKRLICE